MFWLNFRVRLHSCHAHLSKPSQESQRRRQKGTPIHSTVAQNCVMNIYEAISLATHTRTQTHTHKLAQSDSHKQTDKHTDTQSGAQRQMTNRRHRRRCLESPRPASSSSSCLFSPPSLSLSLSHTCLLIFCALFAFVAVFAVRRILANMAQNFFCSTYAQTN